MKLGRLGIVCALAVLLSACGGGGGGTSGGTSAGGTNGGNGANTGGTSTCLDSAGVGSTFTYRSMGTDSVSTITAVNGSRITATNSVGGMVMVTAESDMACNQSAMVSQTSGGTVSNIFTPPLNTVPSSLATGFTETLTSNYRTDLTATACTGTWTHAFNVIGTESVTVPAGTFSNAIKFTLTSSSQCSTPAGGTGGSNAPIVSTEWFVPGLGTVKTLDNASGAISELVSYSIVNRAGGTGGSGGGTPPAGGISPADAGTAPVATAKSLTSLTVSSGHISLQPGTTLQLTAMATYSDGTTADVSSIATWSIADALVGRVTSTGLVTASAALPTGGSSIINVSIGALSSKVIVKVTAATGPFAGPLTALAVSPQTLFVGQATPPDTWASGTVGPLTQNPYGVDWALSACTPANAASYDPIKGLMVGNAAGTCTLTASAETDLGIITTTNTLTIATPILSTISVSPAVATVAAGGALQLSAMGTYSDGSTKDITNLVNWVSLNTAIATVSATGLVTGVAGGTVSVNATKLVSNGLQLINKVGSTSVTVPAVAPAQATVTLPIIWDNTVAWSSFQSVYPPAAPTIPKIDTVYPVHGYNANAIAVGCNWNLMYDPIAGMNIQYFVCARGLMKFDLTSIPAGKTIVSAALQLQAQTVGVGSVPRNWHIHALANNANWTGSTVTWNNSSAYQFYTASAASFAPPTLTSNTYNIDQTNTVRNWYSGAWVNNGLEMGIDNVMFPFTISVDTFEFYSSEDLGGRGPKMVVTYQ